MLELIHVEKSYKKRKAVDDLSFVVQKGEIFGLVGKNGAGKSTTVSMIASLIRPDGGQIQYCGQDITKHPEVIRGKLGYVPQDIALYEALTGYDNMCFWGRAYKVRNDELQDRISEVCGIIGFTKEMLKKKVKEYSGGMKRRLNIGVALLHHPQLVILDEPTAGIDMPSRNHILTAIRELGKNHTAVIYVGHYLEEIEQLCDRICILDHGKCMLDAVLPQALFVPEGKISLEQLYLNIIRDGADH